MDPMRFDALARSFASGSTRRRLVAVLAALPLGGLLAFDEDDAGAERPNDRVKRRNKQRHRKRRNNRGRNKHNHHRHKHKKKGGGKGGVGGPGPCTANGGACNQNNECCGGNCFNQICAAPVTECDGIACAPNATGCCPSGCCASPANQCNGVGECCVPNCADRRCGPDGCGNTGTCGTCPSGSACDKDSGQCGCSPQTCPNGCCDANGDCQPGNTEQACGDGGVSCTQCGSNQHCSTQTGTCRDNPPCSAATCPDGCCFEDDEGFHVCRTDLRGCAPGGPCCSGCCDNDQECQDGNDDGACGAGGSRCVACDPLGGLCDQGRCQCDANNCPDGCCDGGPGNPGLCFVDDPRFCGIGGVLCAGCPTGTQCNGHGQCHCVNTNEFCGASDQCVACPEGTACTAPGECLCTAQSCPSSSGRVCVNNQCVCIDSLCQGCCSNGPGNPGTCEPGNTQQACLTQANVCTACDNGDECVDAGDGLMACCPAGWHSCGVGAGCCPNNLGCMEGGGGCVADVCCATGSMCCENEEGFTDCCVGGCCPEEAPNCCDFGNGFYGCSDSDC